VNCLVGTSNAGKSAVLRALNWVRKNRPLGSNFIRKGSDEAYVNTVWDRSDGELEIGRKKNATENLYELTGHDDFTSPGTSPPQAIIDAMKLSDINVQGQFSPYLLVFDSPGAVATYIRKVTGLADIDAIKDSLAGKERKIGIAVKSKEEDLADVEEKLKEIALVPIQELEYKITQFEETDVRCTENERRSNRLLNLLEEHRILEDQRIDIPEKRFNQIKLDIEAISKTYTENIQKRDKLSKMVETWKLLEAQKIDIPEEDFERIQQEIYYTCEGLERNQVLHLNLSGKVAAWVKLEDQKIDIPLIIPDLATRLLICIGYEQSCDDLLRLGTLIAEADDCKKDIAEVQEQLKILQTEELELYAEVKICPECSSVLTEDTKRALLEKR
jgi:hypothetical protein